MSWAKEEWKQELSANALKNVYDLEQRCETLQKDCKQKQFQMDSLQVALAKQKKLTEDEKANSSSLKKENHFLSESIQELERNREKTLHDLNAKEGQIRCLDGKLARCQQMLDAETASGLRLKNDLDHLQHDQNQLAEKFEKQTADFSKSKEANNLLQRQLAGHKERVRALENQLKSLGEEPNSRAKKSSSGSDSEMEWQSGQENKLKEVEANLQQERQQRQKIEKELRELKANSAKLNSEMATMSKDAITMQTLQAEVSLLPTSETKDSSLELELKSKMTELASATEQLAAKDSELKQKLKELSEMSECLQKKENEITEMNTKLTEVSKIKSLLDESNANIDTLEKKAKQRELDMECQRHNSEAVIKGLDEKLKEKDKEHRQEMHSQSQAIAALEKQCCDLEKKCSNLENKLDNSQKMTEAKDHDIARLRASVSELENRSKQQNSHLDNRYTELEQKAKEQQDEYGKLKQELNGTKVALIEKDGKIADLNRSIEQLKHAIQEKENYLTMKEKKIQDSHGEDEKKLASALEKISLLQKEKADMETESQKAFQQISDEVSARSKELELERQEVTKLKERVVYLENVVSGKEKERQKDEECYKMLCDKLQAAEGDVANNKLEWAKEKAVLEEKERTLQSALEIMKNDFKAMQHDYKKACELADMKSAEATDVIDKLESSQKQWRELQQRLSRTETALKEKENTVTLIMQEKDNLLKEQQRKQEETGKKKEELEQLLTGKNTEIERLKEVLESSNLRLETIKAERTEKDNEIGKLFVELGSIKSQYKKIEDSFQSSEERLANNREMLRKKDVHLQEISAELVSKEKALYDLKQQHTETLAELNRLEQTYGALEVQKDEDLKLIKNKDEEIGSLVKELNDIKRDTVKKLAEMNEQCEATHNEIMFLQEKATNLETLLQNKEGELTESKQELKSSKEELDTLQRHLASKEVSTEESGKENEKLISDLEQMSVALKVKNAELGEVSESLRKLQSEHQSVLEQTGLELEQLKKEEASLKERLEQANTVAESKTEELKTVACQLEASDAEKSELSSMLDELCNTNFKLEDQLAEKTTQLAQVSEAMKAKDEELSNQSKIITSLEKAKDEEAGGIGEQCTLLENQAASLQERCTQLEACLQTKNNDIGSATEKIQQLTAELHDLQNEIVSKGELIEGMKKEKATVIENLQFKTTALEKKEREFKEVSDSFVELKSNSQSAHEATLAELESLRAEVVCLTEKLNQNTLVIGMKDQELESIRNQVQIVGKEKEDLGIKTQELYDQNTTLREKISELQNNLAQSIAAINKKDQELESIDKRLLCIEEEKTNLGVNKEELHHTNAALTERIAELQSSVEQMSNMLKSKDEELMTKSRKLSEMEASGDQQISELEGKCSAQERKLVTLEEKCVQLKACVKGKNEELSRSVATEAELSAKLCTMESMVAGKQESMKCVEEELSSIKQKFEQQQAVIEEKEVKLRELSANLEQEKSKGDEAIKSLQDQLDDSQNALIMAREKLNKINVVVEMKDQDVESMSEQLEAAAEEKKTLGSKLDELTMQCELLQEKNAQLTTNIEQLSSVLKDKDEKLAEKKQEIETFLKHDNSEKLSELQSQSSAQADTIASIQGKCSQLESIVESKQTTLIALEAKLQEQNEKYYELHETIAKTSEEAGKGREENDALKIKLGQSEATIEHKENELKEVLELLEAERGKQQSNSDKHFLETKSLNEDVSSLSERLEKMSAAVEVKDMEIMSMIQNLKSAEEEKAGLANKLDELNSLRLNLQENNASLENKLEQVSTALTTSQDELRVKCHQIEEMQGVSGKEIAEMKEQEIAKSNELLQLREKCGHLAERVDSKESELSVLRSKVEASENTAEVEISTLREKLVSWESELKTKEFTEQDLMNKLTHKEHQLEDATKMTNQQSESIRQLEAQKEMLQMDLEDKDSCIESLNKKVELLKAAVSGLKGRICEKEESNDALSKELSSVTNKLTESLSNEESKENNMEQLKQGIQSLEAQLLTETTKNATMSGELQNVQGNLDSTLVRLEEQLNELQELRENKVANEDKVSKLQSQLDNLVKTLAKAESDKLEMENLWRITEKKLEEDTMQMEKERESATIERNNLLREKSEECSSALEQLQKCKAEIDRLKDTVVHLENVSTSKDQEKMKIEGSYEAFREKTQNREEELLRAYKDLEEEKSSLLEKTRECQAAMEALKHECKAYQQDFKKACGLADSKAQEYRDVIDKLDDSQKHLQETRQKLSRAENALKESKEDVQQARQETTELSEQSAQLKEDFEARIEQLRCEICDKQESVSELSRQLESSQSMVRALETVKHELEGMLSHSKEEFSSAEERLKSFVRDRDEKEVIARNKEESQEVVSILQEQVQCLKVNKSELKSELDNANNELSRLRDDYNSMVVEHTSEMAFKDSEIKQKEDMFKEKQQVAENMVQKVQKEIDSYEAKARETENKIADLLSEKEELRSVVDKKTAELTQLAEKNDELEHACGELRRVKESMEDRIQIQRSELVEKSSEKGRLEEELSAVRMELELTKKHSEDHMKKSAEDQSQKDKELEKLQNLLNARCSQVEKLQRNLNDQTEKLESLKNQVKSLSTELDAAKIEHEQCQKKENSSSNLQEQILELEHLLVREKSNNEAMMRAFQEQEEQWEEEKTKILSSVKNASGNTDSLIAEENTQLKRQLDELQKELSTKEQERVEMLHQTEKRTSSAANMKQDLQSKIRALESQCEEMKYSLKQKDGEIFVKDECIKQRTIEVDNLEAKYAAAEEVERELRHHLGEVTQQLEWSKDDKSETVLKSGSEGAVDPEKIKDALDGAEKELAVLRAERQDRDKWLEDERQKIVEAAKEFALQQEQTFNKRVENLERKVTNKDEELQEMQSILQQLRHDLKTVQQEKNVLLEVADERDREFDEEKKRWNSGSYSYEKIQQYISDLNEERRNVSQLQEKCNGLELKLKELENVNSSLQKDLGEIQKEKKLDSEEREVREDDLYSKVDSLRSESNKLEKKLHTKESLVASLTDEKTKLSMTVASLEEKLAKSAQVVTELQQQCDLMKEQLENLRTEKGRLQEEKDASVMQESQEKLHMEISATKVRELEDKLGEEVKEKNKLSNTVKEMKEILEQEQKCLEKKNKELAEVKTILQLADKENEESIKDKETKLVELTFAYEDLRNKLDKEEKNLEDKSKELKQVKEKLKQTEEKSEEMKEDYERELDRIKFDFRDANNDCMLLREENKELKQNAVGGTGQSDWVKEKKKLLHQLEEAKLRFNQAKRTQEKIESELTQANLKVISLESKGNPTGSEEIKRLKVQVNELNSEVQKWKSKAAKKISNSDNSTRKDEEINNLRSEVCKLQEEVKEWKAAADEKKKAAEKTLATNLKLVNKLEKLNRDKGAASPGADTAAVDKSATGVTSSKPSRVNLVQAVSDTGILLSPLAKSLSNLDIKSNPGVASQGATTQETSSATARSTHPQAAPSSESLSVREERDTDVQAVANRRGIPKQSGTVDTKKRAGEQVADGSVAKRCRVFSRSEASDIAAVQQLPEGMPEVVSRGFASIPAPPVKSPFVIRRTTTTGVRTRSAAKRTVQASSTKVGTENPESIRVPPRGQFAPPEMPLSPRKTNALNIPQGPRSKIPKPGRSQVPRPNNPKMPGASTKQAKHRRRLAPGEGTSKPAGDQQDCKMQ